MNRTRRNFKWGWLGLLCLASVMMFGCGGGGGTPAPDVPTVLNYGVGSANINPVPVLPNGTRANGASFAFSNLQLSGPSTGVRTRMRSRSTITMISGISLTVCSSPTIPPRSPGWRVNHR